MSAIFFGVMTIICSLSMAGWTVAAVISITALGWAQPLTGISICGWVIQLIVIAALAALMSYLKVAE